MLSVRDLTVRYGRVPAVRNLSLDVGEGEIVGLVGPERRRQVDARSRRSSGSSRSAEGDDRPTTERRSSASRPRRSSGAGVALVLEGRHIFNTLTVRGEPAARRRPRIATRVRSDAALDPVLDRFPVLRRCSARRRATSPAASSSSLRSPGPCSPSRGCCCSTSRRSAWPRSSSTWSSRLIAEIRRGRRHRSCSSSRTSSARSSSPTARTSSGTGRIDAVRLASRARGARRARGGLPRF